MDLTLSSEQDQLVDAFVALYARLVDTREGAVAPSPSVSIRSCGPRCWTTGSWHMAVDEVHGGWGATELDLALIAEQHGRAIAAAPLIETQVAARLLAECGESGALPLAAALAGDANWSLSRRDLPVGSVLSSFPPVLSPTPRSRWWTMPWWPSPIDKGLRQVENLASMPLADVPVDDRAVALAHGTGRTRSPLRGTGSLAGAHQLWRLWASPPEQSRSAPSTPSNDTRSVPQSEPSRRCHIRWRTARLRSTVHACSD